MPYWTVSYESINNGQSGISGKSKRCESTEDNEEPLEEPVDTRLAIEITCAFKQSHVHIPTVQFLACSPKLVRPKPYRPYC